MPDYDWSKFGHCMSFRTKLIKHKDNPNRLKDYVLKVFDSFNPMIHKRHPMWSEIEEAIENMKKGGWKVGKFNWKDRGIQMVCMSPDGEYYTSRYKHVVR